MKRATGMNSTQRKAANLLASMWSRNMPAFLSVGEAASMCSDYGVHAPRWETQAARGSTEQVSLGKVALFIARRIDD